MVLAQMILFILNDISAVICYLLVLSTIWQFKERSRICTVITCSAALVISVVNAYVGFRAGFEGTAIEDTETIPIFLTMIVPLIVLKVKKYFRSIIVMLTTMVSVEAIYGIVGFVFKTDSLSLKATVIEFSFIFVIYSILSVILFASKKVSDLTIIKNAFDTVPKWMFPIWFVLIFTIYFINFSLNDDIYDTTFIVEILFAVSAVCIFVCIIYFIYKIFSMSFQQTQILKQLNEQHENYANMLSSDQQLREFRHDYKNHMMVVTALLNAGKNDEATEYLEKIKIQSGITKRQISTGNFVADAILNNKNSLAHELDINLKFYGTIPEKGIDSSDLCTVLANLLDNAIEGTKRYNGDKYINVDAYARDNTLVLSIENPVNNIVTIKNNRIKTTKSDSRNHGIGLKNVEKIAEKYHGKFRLSCDENEFTADISLKLED